MYIIKFEKIESYRGAPKIAASIQISILLVAPFIFGFGSVLDETLIQIRYE